MAKLKVENLTKEFPTRAEPLVVLRDVSFEIRSGQNMAILGPSGSGKSTLLNLLGTLEPPTSGRVVLDGVNPTALYRRQLALFRNQRIGFVFQDHGLLPQLSVLENVLVPCLANAGMVASEQIERASILLERVRLADRAEHRPAELSGGERQRAAIARALINRPTLLLADEPTGNLDQTNGRLVGELLVEMQRQESAILIVVTHSRRLADMMARRCELDDGRLREEKTARPCR